LIDWQPAAAVAGLAPHMTAPKHILLHVFGTRFKFSPAPADLAAARNRNTFTLRFSGAAWSRLLMQLHSSGLGLNPAVRGAVAPPRYLAVHMAQSRSPMITSERCSLLESYREAKKCSLLRSCFGTFYRGGNNAKHNILDCNHSLTIVEAE